MRGKIKKVVNKAVQIIGSRYFFWFIIALFVFQAVWIALSFRYSMMYDEYYHFGLIEYFSHQWLPWINNQSVNLDQYSALARSPYLFYHYLLSFPFRIVALFTSDFYTQVISTRFINIGLFVGGLVVFAKLFKAMKIQPIFRNVALLFLVLLPVTPFVAATVSYDNAIFLLTAIFMFVGIRIIQSPKIQWHDYVLIVLIGMAGSLMKIAFLPIFAAGFIYVFIHLFINHRKKIKYNFIQSFIASSLWLKLLLIISTVIVGFFFIERFGVNIIQYHSLEPSCAVQIGAERCRSNYVELRSGDLKKARTGVPAQAPQYTLTWISTMESGLLITGANTKGKYGTEMGQPLPIISVVVSIGAIVSLATFFYSFDKLRKLSGFWMMMSISILYVGVLFYKNFSDYYTYYQAIAIQGRYLLPLLPVIMVFLVLGINYTMKKRLRLKLVTLIVVLVFYMNGAGIITHIIRSRNAWYWDNQTVYQVNNEAKNLLNPFVKEYWYEKEK